MSEKNGLVKNASFLMMATLISRVIGLLYRSPLGGARRISIYCSMQKPVGQGSSVEQTAISWYDRGSTKGGKPHEGSAYYSAEYSVLVRTAFRYGWRSVRSAAGRADAMVRPKPAFFHGFRLGNAGFPQDRSAEMEGPAAAV